MGDGAEAVRALRIVPYDLVFMDCQMPHMNGYEATRRIRQAERAGQRTAIVALTANVLNGERDRCIEAGMDDYLAKPVRTEQVMEKLRQWLPKEKSSTPEPKGTGASWDGVREREQFRSLAAAIGEAEAWQLLGTFSESVPDSLAALDRAVHAGDFQATASIAHKFRGSCSTLGLLSMAGVLFEIEAGAREEALHICAEGLAALRQQVPAVLENLRLN